MGGMFDLVGRLIARVKPTRGFTYKDMLRTDLPELHTAQSCSLPTDRRLVNETGGMQRLECAHGFHAC
jgi:hypothetical protein